MNKTPSYKGTLIPKLELDIPHLFQLRTIASIFEGANIYHSQFELSCKQFKQYNTWNVKTEKSGFFFLITSSF